MDKIQELAESFRAAIDRAYENNEFTKYATFSQFPNDCCDIACDLLGQYLLEHGIQTIQINGININDDDWHHVWLIVDDIVIDITGDQFVNKILSAKEVSSVHVGEEGRVHKLFGRNKIVEVNTNFMNPNEFYGFNKQPNARQKMLIELYEIICRYLPID